MACIKNEHDMFSIPLDFIDILMLLLLKQGITRLVDLADIFQMKKNSIWLRKEKLKEYGYVEQDKNLTITEDGEKVVSNIIAYLNFSYIASKKF